MWVCQWVLVKKQDFQYINRWDKLQIHLDFLYNKLQFKIAHNWFLFLKISFEIEKLYCPFSPRPFWPLDVALTNPTASVFNADQHGMRAIFGTALHLVFLKSAHTNKKIRCCFSELNSELSVSPISIESKSGEKYDSASGPWSRNGCSSLLIDKKRFKTHFLTL